MVTDILIDTHYVLEDDGEEGSYSFPSGCNRHKLGSCQFVISWAKGKNADEANFQLQSSNKWTAIGFTKTKDLEMNDISFWPFLICLFS